MRTVLFVCVHNAGRSQMAEAIFNHEAARRGSTTRAKSAGTVAGSQVNPLAKQALEEIGIDTAGLEPKQLTQAMVDDSALVVTMGCGVDAAACPARFIVSEDWGLEDPAGRPMDEVRAIRDLIVERVNGLLEQTS